MICSGAGHPFPGSAAENEQQPGVFARLILNDAALRSDFISLFGALPACLETDTSRIRQAGY
ncbi:MAG: hypothetical protein R3E89_14270 [Thiolinea sp.]